MTILEQVKEDVKAAMKAGERSRVSALRLVADSLSAEHREGKGDEVAALRRERKKRLDAVEAFAGAGREEAAASEQAEADLIASYLPAEMPDEVLVALVDAAVAESGASGPQDMGKAMGAVMAKVAGRVEGGRVSAAVRERLGS